MTYPAPSEIALMWWSAIDRAEFDSAIALMAPDAVVDWPLSNERMPDPESWKQVNEHYPGHWHARVRSVITQDNIVVTNADITDGGITIQAISYFTIESGRIVNLVEYWPETYAAPNWRSKWVTPIPASHELQTR